MIAAVSQESLNGSLERFVYTKWGSASAFDFNVSPLFLARSYCVQFGEDCFCVEMR